MISSPPSFHLPTNLLVLILREDRGTLINVIMLPSQIRLRKEVRKEGGRMARVDRISFFFVILKNMKERDGGGGYTNYFPFNFANIWQGCLATSLINLA